MRIYSEPAMLAAPSVSDWLKCQIVESRRRDILDALNDAETLAAILRERWEAIKSAA